MTLIQNFILGDNMDPNFGLPSFPDNYFGLAVVDPPYGGILNKKNGHGSLKDAVKKYGSEDWDYPPGKEYFEQLFRVSKNQIIFGANHFVEYLPVSRGWIFWDKKRENQDFSDGELAFTSFDKGLKKAVFAWDGFRQGDMKNPEKRIHPTQKPVRLYQWILKTYAKPGDIILDTHVGSGSSLIACQSLGFDYVGFELSKKHYTDARNRIKKGIQKILI